MLEFEVLKLRRKGPAPAALLVMGLALLVSPAFAEEDHEAGEAHGEHEFHRHHVSVFLGITEGEVEGTAGGTTETASTVDAEALTVGLEYVYRLSRRWGVGALADYAGEDLDTLVVGIPVVLHAGERLKLLVAPGIEDKDEGSSEFLVRVGAMYEFEVGGFSIAPTLDLDFVGSEQTFAYGLNFGKGF